MSNTQDCPFCNLNERRLKENDAAILFLSNPRKMRGHFLVSPKRHVEKPWELTKEELEAISELVLFVQKRIAEKFSTGCDVRQNYRPFLPQGRVKVDHVHYHIMPRDLYDELYEKVEKYETDLFEDLSSAEHDELAKLVE